MAAQKPVGKRAQRVADTRARIIDCALDLFIERGFVATSIDDIAAAAGIGRSSFFRYFEGKEAVVFAPMLAQENWFLAQLVAWPPAPSLIHSVIAICRQGDWPTLQRKDLRRVQRVVRREPQLVNAFYGHLAASFSEQLKRLLSERDPEAAAVTVKIIADTAVSWIDWAIRAHVSDGRPLSEHFAEAIAATAGIALQVTQ